MIKFKVRYFNRLSLGRNIRKSNSSRENKCIKRELSDLKLEQELCVQKLGESLQKLNSLSPKNIKRNVCRRETKIAELKVANKQILIKLNEERLKEVANSSTENIEYAEEINNLNKLLNESLVWKTKHQKLKWYHNFAMKKKIQWK